MNKTISKSKNLNKYEEWPLHVQDTFSLSEKRKQTYRNVKTNISRQHIEK